MQKRDTIAFFISNLEVGGAERVAVNLANAFVQQGYKVVMLLVCAKGDLLHELHPEIEVVDFKLSRIRYVLLPLVWYLRQQKPHALVAYAFPLTGMTVLAQKLARVRTRVVVTEHTTWSFVIKKSPLSGVILRVSMRYLLAKAHAVIAVSQGVADDLIDYVKLSSKTIRVIYNPVIQQHLSDSLPVFEPQDWCEGRHFKIIAVGNLKSEKDYPTLLTAFAQLRTMVNAKLLICGEGPCRQALTEQIKQLGIETDVFMPGLILNPMPYYVHADLHVLSSVCEGLSTVIIEALAAGTPVVSTDCRSSPREILLDGKLGRLVPVGNARALSHAMQAALLNDCVDVAALKSRAEDFTIIKAMQQYEQVCCSEES